MPDRRFLAPTLPQHLLRRAALAVGLLAAAAAGCQVCNDIGCDGGFEWNAETADGSGLAPGVYALEITLDVFNVPGFAQAVTYYSNNAAGFGKRQQVL